MCGKSAEKEKIMKSAAMMNMLEEIKALHNQNELSEADSERWDFLCKSVDNGYFRDTLLEYLDDDQELTVQILDYLKKTGSNIEQLVVGGVAVGMYLLGKLYPTDWNRDKSLIEPIIVNCGVCYALRVIRIVSIRIKIRRHQVIKEKFIQDSVMTCHYGEAGTRNGHT